MWSLLLLLLLAAEQSAAVSRQGSTIGSLSQFTLHITYSWPSSKTNLDTSTTFVRQSVGANCAGQTDYVQWNGDVRTAGGQESAALLLNKANEDGVIGGFAFAQLSADYENENIGSATLRVAFRRLGSTTDISPQSITINAGTKRGGCSSSPVAVVFIQSSGGRVVFTVSNEGLIRPTPRPQSYIAKCYEDPHVRTFDGLYAGCQGKGEFILTKTDGFEMQGRFGGAYKKVTLPIGFAIKHGNLPIVEVSRAENLLETHSRLFGDCNFMFAVNKQKRKLEDGSGHNEIEVKVLGYGRVTILFKTSGIFVYFYSRKIGSQCKTEMLTLKMPNSFSAGKTFVGLFGSPNGNRYDDIMDKDGKTVTGLGWDHEKLYNHCVKNWCIQDQKNSLFRYENSVLQSTSLKTYNQCDDPYRKVHFSSRSILHSCGTGIPCIHEATVKTSAEDQNAIRTVRENCGVNEVCLFEGMAMIEEESAAVAIQAVGELLQAEAEASKEKEEESSFAFTPSTVQSRMVVPVQVTLDTHGAAKNVEKYHIYNLDVERNVVLGEKIGELSRMSASSNVFSTEISVRTDSVGQKLSYRAVPLISGSEDRSANSVKDAVDVIQSFRAVPMTVDSPPSATVLPPPLPVDDVRISRASLEGLVLFVKYTWPADVENLNSATAFMNEKAGHLCQPFGTYARYAGDIEAKGGTETALIFIGQAEKDKKWTQKTVVNFFAVFPHDVTSPATLRILLFDLSKNKVVDGTSLQESIAPGKSSGCANKLVASLAIEKDGTDYTFNISVE